MNIKGSSATLKLWIGPGNVDIISPLEVRRAKIGIEYVDYWKNKKLVQMYATVSAAPIHTGMIEMKPFITLQNTPNDMEYIFVWIEDMNISEKGYLPSKKIDMHECGLAVLEERWRLSEFESMKGDDGLVDEVNSVVRE